MEPVSTGALIPNRRATYWWLKEEDPGPESCENLPNSISQTATAQTRLRLRSLVWVFAVRTHNICHNAGLNSKEKCFNLKVSMVTGARWQIFTWSSVIYWSCAVYLPGKRKYNRVYNEYRKQRTRWSEVWSPQLKEVKLKARKVHFDWAVLIMTFTAAILIPALSDVLRVRPLIFIVLCGGVGWERGVKMFQGLDCFFFREASLSFYSRFRKRYLPWSWLFFSGKRGAWIFFFQKSSRPAIKIKWSLPKSTFNIYFWHLHSGFSNNNNNKIIIIILFQKSKTFMKSNRNNVSTNDHKCFCR